MTASCYALAATNMNPDMDRSSLTADNAPVLTDLEISGVGIIDHVHLELAPGLNVLTGETGAGKTMVVTGLQWLLGRRADKDKVRSGAKGAVVQARIEGAGTWAGDWTDDDELLVVREVGARGDDDQSAGRSRARLSGRMAPASVLAEVLAPVIEIHSQHESLRLADLDEQRRLLDRFGSAMIDGPKTAYRAAYEMWREAVTMHETAQRSSRDDAREADRLRFEVDEIRQVAPRPGEEDELDEAINRLEYAESLRNAATTTASALTAEHGARDALGAAVDALRGVVAHDASLEEPLGRLEAVLAEAQEIAFEMASYADGLDADPAGLDQTLGRRAAIGGLLRKYGPHTTDVIAYLEQAEERLTIVDGGDERLRQLRQAADQAEKTLTSAGDSLRAARLQAAGKLQTVVDRHLTELAMPDARTEIQVQKAAPRSDGADRVEFLLSANRGQPALPLGGSASGGERSRVALAVKVALADADDTPIMVFDEVDAGIGGETALEVGRKLSRLADRRQVLCVTHLAQLAAFADAHFVITKEVVGGATVTNVERLDDTQRATELSRMLSGATTSQVALSHAAELLQVAAANT